ncbi:TPA: hypothetical protein ACGO0Z_001533, partial [Streptococcus suis]
DTVEIFVRIPGNILNTSTIISISARLDFLYDASKCGFNDKKTATKLATVPYDFIFYDKRFFHLKL